MSIFEEKDISLNELEKKSFYSFVVLYLVSSFGFIFLSAYWYYNAQKNSLENETYYKLEHLADKLSASIINAQMKGTTLHLPNEQGFEYELISLTEATHYKVGYFEKDGYKVLVSDAPQEHLNIAYVLVKTRSYFERLSKLHKEIAIVVFLSCVFVLVISFVLSKLFLRPLHNRMVQIEDFIQDVTHELNTPVSALKMSASRALSKKVYDEKILRNISISTKQLESIYKSLSYLNFKQNTQELQQVDLKKILEQTIHYYQELTDAKKITVTYRLEDVSLYGLESRIEILFSNLLSNAIKYSMPQSTIRILLTPTYCLISDEGVGIEKTQLKEIFQIYTRSSNLAGGFGVGLSIVKRICDEYGITIEVESQIDVGTNFKLLFPDKTKYS